MNFRTYCKKLLVSASVWYALITVAYLIILWIVNIGDEEFLIPADRLLFNALFALLVAAAQSVRRLPRLEGAWRLLAHYGILLLSFYLCFLVPASMRAAQVLIGLVGFSAVYFAVMGIAALFRSRFRSNAEKEAAYTKQYAKKR